MSSSTVGSARAGDSPWTSGVGAQLTLSGDAASGNHSLLVSARTQAQSGAYQALNAFDITFNGPLSAHSH